MCIIAIIAAVLSLLFGCITFLALLAIPTAIIGLILAVVALLSRCSSVSNGSDAFACRIYVCLRLYRSDSLHGWHVSGVYDSFAGHIVISRYR